MKKIIAIFTIFMMISTSMIACEKEEKTTINFLNWGENIAEGLIDEFEKKYVSQGYQTNRDSEETLSIGWSLLSILPRSELKRIKDEFLDKYYEEEKS